MKSSEKKNEQKKLKTHEKTTQPRSKLNRDDIFSYWDKLKLEHIKDPFPQITTAEEAYFKFDYETLKDHAFTYLIFPRNTGHQLYATNANASGV